MPLKKGGLLVPFDLAFHMVTAMRQSRAGRPQDNRLSRAAVQWNEQVMLV
jgi:hypothetical protein